MVRAAAVLLLEAAAARELLLVGLYDGTNFTGDSAHYNEVSLLTYALNGLKAPTLQASSRIGMSPSWMTQGATSEHFFTLSETSLYDGKVQGSVSSFDIDCDGKAHITSREGCGGDIPAHLAVVKESLLVANYGGGNVGSLQIDAKGRLMPLSNLLDYGNTSHPHMISVFEDRVFVPTLGLDKVQQLDAGLKPFAEPLPVPEGQGPRHIKFFPDGRGVLTNEGAANVTSTVVFVQLGDDGLSKLATYKTLPDDMSSHDMYPAEVVLVEAPEGSWVLVSNRDATEKGRDGITVFKREGDELKKLDYVRTGHYPRSMTLSWVSIESALVIAGNQKADSLSMFTFSVDGRLEPLGKEFPVVDEKGTSQSPGFVGVFKLPECDTVLV